MNLRIFRRIEARFVQPGNEIQFPRPMLVREIVQSAEGLTLRGPSPRYPEGRNVTVKLNASSPVELPLFDTAERKALSGLLDSAFTALEKRDVDDDVPEGDRFKFRWLPDEEAWDVRLGDGYVRIATTGAGPVTAEIVDEEPTPEPATVPRSTRATRTRKAAPATPPANAEPDISS
jgi:hypothetical protein